MLTFYNPHNRPGDKEKILRLLTSPMLQNPLTATLLTSILAAVLGSLQIGYHTGNVNAPAKVSQRVVSCGEQI